MGSLAMGKCENKQINNYNIEINYKHSKGEYAKLPLGDVYTCHGFFNEHASLKKPIPQHFFTSLLNDLSI
jgi:hypothetical protein